MPIVQVHVEKCGIKDVLLDGGFGGSMVFESLKKLGLRKPKPVPFVMRMVNQRKVQPFGLIRNLKIDLASCEYKIFITMHIKYGEWNRSLFNAFGKTLAKTSQSIS
jgi:hypothetical protein